MKELVTQILNGREKIEDVYFVAWRIFGRSLSRILFRTYRIQDNAC